MGDVILKKNIASINSTTHSEFDFRIREPGLPLGRFVEFDQAHLIRDFKRHTGTTPAQYVEAQPLAFSSGQTDEAAGFVLGF